MITRPGGHRGRRMTRNGVFIKSDREARDPRTSSGAAGDHRETGEAEPHIHDGVADSDHRHTHGHTHTTGAMRWGPAAIGLAVHSLIGGVAMASAVQADFRVGRGALGAGLGVFDATLVQKPADALTITALMLESGAARRYTHLVNLGFALMIPAGVVLFGFSTRLILPISTGSWTSAALAFSAGTFLCIALSDLLPELQFHSHDRVPLSIALLAGFALMMATAIAEPAIHRDTDPNHGAHPAATR
jgi:zinc and cadmium transporter